MLSVCTIRFKTVGWGRWSDIFMTQPAHGGCLSWLLKDLGHHWLALFLRHTKHSSLLEGLYFCHCTQFSVRRIINFNFAYQWGLTIASLLISGCGASHKTTWWQFGAQKLAFLHYNGSSNSNLNKCMDSWFPQEHISWRISHSYKHSFEQTVPNSDITGICSVWNQNPYTCTTSSEMNQWGSYMFSRTLDSLLCTILCTQTSQLPYQTKAAASTCSKTNF